MGRTLQNTGRNFQVDLYFSESGDFLYDSDVGDLLDTSMIHMRTLIQRINTQLASSSRSWRHQPGVGADLHQFLGKQNSQETGDNLRNRVFGALVGTGILRPNELSIEVFPLTEKQIAVVLLVQLNRQRGETILTFTYDTRDNRIIPRNI